MDYLSLIGREHPLFAEDIERHDALLRELVGGSRFLVVGGAGSIGQAVTREIFRRGPAALHVADISENNMVELVRDLRSTLGYIPGDFSTFAIDCGAPEFQALLRTHGPYDYVLNLSAMKHVRSEKDPFTLMRMVQLNVFNTVDIVRATPEARKHFCVSTDKAANPVNMMGASKRIMEMFLMRESESSPVSTARFANVAFSDGSLLHGFNQRFAKRQPVSAPRDVRRYFVTPQEAGELCLMSCLLGANRDIFFPKLTEELHLVTFAEIAVKYLAQLGFRAVECDSEDEARRRARELIARGEWPCYFFDSDTTGEKDAEEFFTGAEELDFDRFQGIGVIHNHSAFDSGRLDWFSARIAQLRASGRWNKEALVEAFLQVLPDFGHKETGRHLDNRM